MKGMAMDKQSDMEDITVKVTWKIPNFSKLNTKNVRSHIFYTGNYKWRLLVFPKGNKVNQLSIYLVVADSMTLPLGWSRSARFSISVVHQVLDNRSVRRKTEHQFCAKETYWGFPSFMPLHQLNNPVGSYLVNDTCIIDVTLSCSCDCKKGGLEPSPDVGVELRGINDSTLTVGYSPSTSSTPAKFVTKDLVSCGISEDVMAAWCDYTSDPSHVSVLRRLLQRHGDIFEKLNLQSLHLILNAMETVANAATILSKPYVKDLSNSDREFLFASVPYLSSFCINVGWLEEKVQVIRGVHELSAAESALEGIVNERNDIQALLDQKVQKEIEASIKVDELKMKYGEGKLGMNDP